jgi:hypothetical protein
VSSARARDQQSAARELTHQRCQHVPVATPRPGAPLGPTADVLRPRRAPTAPRDRPVLAPDLAGTVAHAGADPTAEGRTLPDAPPPNCYPSRLLRLVRQGLKLLDKTRTRRGYIGNRSCRVHKMVSLGLLGIVKLLAMRQFSQTNLCMQGMTLGRPDGSSCPRPDHLARFRTCQTSAKTPWPTSSLA